MKHAAGEIGSFAQQRIADDIEIGVTSQAEAGGEGGSACLFNIDQHLEGVVEAHAGIQRHQARGGFLITRTEAMRAAVGRVKVGMGLKNEVGLAGEPEARVLEMREHRFWALVRWRVGADRGRLGSPLAAGLATAGGGCSGFLRLREGGQGQRDGECKQ